MLFVELRTRKNGLKTPCRHVMYEADTVQCESYLLLALAVRVCFSELPDSQL
jgi:hypothetical protein